MESTRSGAYVALFLIGMAGIFTGLPNVVSPAESIAGTCVDGINNDGDQGGLAPLFVDIDDSQDIECLWMPFDFGQGEYDGQGEIPPNPNEVSIYVSTWRTVDNYPTYFEAVLELGIIDQRVNVECNFAVQDAMIEYRDTYNLPDSKTGVSQHQAHCGVSY